jgi:LytR cell envelope-related transcriptional attenuator
MEQAARTGLTLAGLAALVVLGGLLGWAALTQPFPEKTTPPKCVATKVSPGEKVFPGQVTVSVFNAGGRNGLASSTMAALVDAGFAEGDTGNAPSGAKVARVQIWAPSPQSPDVRLLKSRLGPETPVVKQNGPGAGLNVMVGDGFTQLVKGPPSVKATKEAEICSPPVA